MNENTKQWQFVHAVSGGWWLKLTSDEDIVRYIRATNDRYDGALCKAVHEPIENMSLENRIRAQLNGDRNYMFLQAATVMAQKYNTTLYSGFEHMQTEFGMALHRDICEVYKYESEDNRKFCYGICNGFPGVIAEKCRKCGDYAYNAELPEN